MILTALVTLAFFASCEREMMDDVFVCGWPEDSPCTDTVPLDEACDAYFSRWFFDQQANSCQQINYSGCSQKGFATQEDCETCKCSDDDQR